MPLEFKVLRLRSDRSVLHATVTADGAYSHRVALPLSESLGHARHFDVFPAQTDDADILAWLENLEGFSEEDWEVRTITVSL